MDSREALRELLVRTRRVIVRPFHEKSAYSQGALDATCAAVMALRTVSRVILQLLAAIYAATGIGLFRSTDGGTTFDRYSWPRATPISTLAIDPLTPGTLYAAGQKSTDAGASWFAANSGIPQGGIVALAIDPKTPATVYAATNAYECGTGNVVGIYKSVDGGANWADTRSGIGCGLTAVVVDPQDPSTVYAGSLYRGVYKSMDGGASWSVMNSGLPSVGPGPNVNALAVDPKNSGTLYAGVGSGLFKTTDGAAIWNKTGLTSGASALAIDPQNTSSLYAVTSNGLFKSTDGGAGWRNLSPPSSTTVFAVAINPQSPSTIYAGTDTGVAQSTDGGESWTKIPGGSDNVRVLALDPQDPNTVYAGGHGGFLRLALVPKVLAPSRPDSEGEGSGSELRSQRPPARCEIRLHLLYLERRGEAQAVAHLPKEETQGAAESIRARFAQLLRWRLPHRAPSCTSSMPMEYYTNSIRAQIRSSRNWISASP